MGVRKPPKPSAQAGGLSGHQRRLNLPYFFGEHRFNQACATSKGVSTAFHALQNSAAPPAVASAAHATLRDLPTRQTCHPSRGGGGKRGPRRNHHRVRSQQPREMRRGEGQHPLQQSPAALLRPRCLASAARQGDRRAGPTAPARDQKALSSPRCQSASLHKADGSATGSVFRTTAGRTPQPSSSWFAISTSSSSSQSPSGCRTWIASQCRTEVNRPSHVNRIFTGAATCTSLEKACGTWIPWSSTLRHG